jgi:hypothetical protein
VDLVVGRREIHEVERVHEHGGEPRLRAQVAEAREVVRVVLREAPHARALREELQRVRADLDGPVERLLHAAVAVAAEQHPANVAAR